MKKSGDFNEFERRLGEVIVEPAEIADGAKLKEAKVEIAKLKRWNVALYSKVQNRDTFCNSMDCYEFSNQICGSCYVFFCYDHLEVYKSDLTFHLTPKIICLGCEPDFAGKNPTFWKLAKDLKEK